MHLSWDADSLYLAVSVLDDVLDRQPIGPGENVWEGPGGQRKDKMFYYDHLKVFLRGPEQPLGFNLWVAPNACEASSITLNPYFFDKSCIEFRSLGLPAK